MRFDDGKAFPHPVLRHGSRDYPDAEFQAQLDLVRQENGSGVRLSAQFDLSAPNLLELIERGDAQYTLILSCSMTHFRMACTTATPCLERDIPPGKLCGLTELLPFVVASSELRDFRSDCWHEDFRGIGRLDIPPGTVLAADSQKTYFIDNAEEAPISSIFETREITKAQDGQWECNLDGERVRVLLSPSDHHRLSRARIKLNNTAEAAYLMNSLWLPALHHVLVLADANTDDYDGRRWFRALDARLSEAKCLPLGSDRSDRLKDAQQLLDYPFASLPCLDNALAAE